MIKSFLIAGIASVLVAVAGAALWGWQGMKTLEMEADLQEPMLYMVPRGTSYNAVARDLKGTGGQGDLAETVGQSGPGDALHPGGRVRVSAGHVTQRHDFPDGSG